MRLFSDKVFKVSSHSIMFFMEGLRLLSSYVLKVLMC